MIKISDVLFNGQILDPVLVVQIYLRKLISEQFITVDVKIDCDIRDNLKFYLIYCQDCQKSALSNSSMIIRLYNGLELNCLDWLGIWSWIQVHVNRECFKIPNELLENEKSDVVS